MLPGEQRLTPPVVNSSFAPTRNGSLDFPQSAVRNGPGAATLKARPSRALTLLLGEEKHAIKNSSHTRKVNTPKTAAWQSSREESRRANLLLFSLLLKKASDWKRDYDVQES